MRKFYAQDGIDAILKCKLRDQKIFYVDVGANHPLWASNTYSFYKCGSRGINIDAAPNSMSLFKILRRGDINLEVPISSNTNVPLKFFIFESSALNSFDEKLLMQRAKRNKLKKVIKLRAHKLSEILDRHLPKSQRIDLLSVDTEGHDLEVLKSNNWKKYKPKFIIIEEFLDINKNIRCC